MERSRLACLAGVCLVLLGAAPAVAQIACPVGTAAGSATCGPAPAGEMPSPPPRPSGEWIKTWGAIATSSSGGGVSSRQLSREEAESLALRNCTTSGARNCRVEFSYRNQCVALAYPPGNGSQIDTAASVERAKARALKRCNDRHVGECKVALAECSEPVFHEY